MKERPLDLLREQWSYSELKDPTAPAQIIYSKPVCSDPDEELVEFS